MPEEHSVAKLVLFWELIHAPSVCLCDSLTPDSVHAQSCSHSRMSLELKFHMSISWQDSRSRLLRVVKSYSVCRPTSGTAKPTQPGNADCEPAPPLHHAGMGAGEFLPVAGTPRGVAGRTAPPLQHHCVDQGVRDRAPWNAWAPLEQQASGFGPVYGPGGPPTAAGKSVLKQHNDENQPQHADQAVLKEPW